MKDLTLVALVRIALRNLVVIILCAAIFAVGAFVYCKFITDPVYSATGSVLVTNGEVVAGAVSGDKSVSNTDITASVNLSYTVRDILRNPKIYQQLSEKLNGKYSYQALSSKATIADRENYSLFIKVSFTANTKEEAILLTNEFLKLAPNFIGEFIPGTATITTDAFSASKVSPRTTVATFIAAIIGAALAYVIAVIVYSSNTVIHGEMDFKERFDIPIIGVVPDFSAARSEKYYKNYGEYFNTGGSEDAERE